MIYHVNDYDFDLLADIPVLKRGSGRHSRKITYLDMITAFDIETTNIDKYRQSVMYIWQYQINEDTIIGRCWEDFKRLITILSGYAAAQGALIVCYVHNLSFEYQFIKSIIPIDLCFAMDNRKILKCVSGSIEFRCSYLHSNMSLDKYLQTQDVENKKIHGFDYEKKRYPWTRLTDEELQYCINDVKGLVQAVKHEMVRDGDNLYTIPLTSTGYARREAKKVLGRYVRYVRPVLPDIDVFQALRKAFRGGNTHANRYNANIIHVASDLEPIESYDISSSYPAVLLTERYPGKFRRADPELLWLFLKHDQACLMHIILYDIRLQDESWGCPYIPKAKCESINAGIYDNGRVLQAAHAEMFITEIDFSIILSEYDFTYEVVELWTANKRKLPLPFRQMLLEQYQKKTSLKGVDDYMAGKYKGKFNSNYGMMVQNPCKPEWILQPDGSLEVDLRPMEELLKEYHHKGWLPYQWGVYCTAYARLKLEEGLRCIPPDRFLYADTDSIKYVGSFDDIFSELNKKYIHEDLSAVDAKGKRHYIGVFEKDASYKRFITMGAKKYAYEDISGSLHVTISGVDKRTGAEELGCLENFKEGFIFRKAGGTEHIYNDVPPVSSVRIQGHTLPITSNIAIYPSTYTLSQTMEYKRLIAYLCTNDISYSLHYER